MKWSFFSGQPGRCSCRLWRNSSTWERHLDFYFTYHTTESAVKYYSFKLTGSEVAHIVNRAAHLSCGYPDSKSISTGATALCSLYSPDRRYDQQCIRSRSWSYMSHVVWDAAHWGKPPLIITSPSLRTADQREIPGWSFTVEFRGSLTWLFGIPFSPASNSSWRSAYWFIRIMLRLVLNPLPQTNWLRGGTSVIIERLTCPHQLEINKHQGHCAR